MKMLVKDALHYGRGNAISSKLLASLLGFQSVRELQAQIARERSAGAVILSTTLDGGGYFLSDDPAELQRFTRTLEARARNTIRAAQSALQALNAAIGQESMEGFFNAE